MMSIVIFYDQAFPFRSGVFQDYASLCKNCEQRLGRHWTVKRYNNRLILSCFKDDREFHKLNSYFEYKADVPMHKRIGELRMTKCQMKKVI